MWASNHLCKVSDYCFTEKKNSPWVGMSLHFDILPPSEPFLAPSNICYDALTNKIVFLSCTLKYRVNAQCSKVQGYGV